MSLSGDRKEQNLKGRYFKYLEALCVSNGIEMDKLKTVATDYELLEMFFGGLPVLVGLRYFDHLTTIRLVGQEIQNISPISEVSETLEELWICECTLSDLGGLETCVKVRKLYLYSNQISDASLLSSLKSLEVLWIQDNRLTSLQFLKDIEYLSTLKVGGDQFNDCLAMSISQWPSKLQLLDISGSTLCLLQSLLGLSCCGILRQLNICNDKYPSNCLIKDEDQIVWLTFHFPFLEYLDGDQLNENFVNNYTMKAEKKAALEINKMITKARKMVQQLDTIRKNEAKIKEKLTSFINALNKASAAVSKKEGRRELTLKLQDLYQLKLKSLSNSIVGCIKCEREVFYVSSYLLPSWQMESAGRTVAREATKTELLDLEHTFQSFCTVEEPKMKVKTAVMFSLTPLNKTEMKELHFLQSSDSPLWDFADFVDVGNQRLASDGEGTFKLVKDLSAMCGENHKTLCTCIWPVVKLKKDQKPKIKEVDDANGNNFELQGKEDGFTWNQMELVGLCVMELQRSSWPSFEELKNFHHFDEHINDQVKKLKDLGIELKLEKIVAPLQQQATEDEGDQENQEVIKTNQEVKVLDVISDKLSAGRYRLDGPIWTGKELSLRNPAELSLAYTKPMNLQNPSVFDKIVTLNLEGLQIDTLDGIEQLENVRYLSLACNKLSSIKRVKALEKLLFLDVSHNNVHKIDELPGTLTGLKAAQNQLSTIGFCMKLQNLTYFNLSHNKIKSIKGIEELKTLQTFLITDNLLKDKTEVDVLQQLPNLRFVDLVGNPLADEDNYKNVILNSTSTTKTENGESASSEQPGQVVRKAGKILTMDFLQKEFGENLNKDTEFNLSDNQFHMIALIRNGLDILQHVTTINLSDNHLQHLYELAHLPNLVQLNLSNNQILSLTTDSVPKILPKLELLDLSSNNLTCQSVARIGLQKLPQLKRLILTGNKLSRFDAALFDFENLEALDLSGNDIKVIRKKNLKHLKKLDLSENDLKDLEGLTLPNLITLNVSKNKISSCAAMKSLKELKNLKSLDCSENPVTARRVYSDYIKKQLPGLEELDSEVVIRSNNNNEQVDENDGVATEKVARPHLAVRVNPLAVQIANEKSSAVKRYMDFKLLKEKSDVVPVAETTLKPTEQLKKTQSLFNMVTPETNNNLNDFLISGKRITKYNRHYKMS
ncbi:unnamed protein product [Bursaphelenchus okinawaensis]|uniref:Protein phosphatase 1 regulatory subunit 7 n=1 Tax=Bursaphelenchus okinawaensis TaxID=465554 RepID=A0A811L8K9_9BILA|nr:unnamed protein product [Bursaphelenchus okinawaensis]CAG9119877.1 unnamed protein product [Bursaphelenchus okinawaensis]